MGPIAIEGRKNKFIGSDDSDLAKSSSKNEYFELGEGDDYIDFDLSDGKKIGNNTVVYQTDEQLTLNFNGDSDEHRVSPAYIKGNVVLEVRNGDKLIGKVTLKPKTGKSLPDKISIKFENGNSKNVDLIKYKNTGEDVYKYEFNGSNGSFAIGNANSKKSQKLMGTFMTETITGGLGADKIYTGHGDDIVTGNEGNDLITVDGAGDKTIYYGESDGNDTIHATYYDDDYLTVNVVSPVKDTTNYKFQKDGLDMIITGVDSQGKEVQSLTLKDYSHIQKNPGYENLTFRGNKIETMTVGKTIEVTPTTVGDLLKNDLVAGAFADEASGKDLAKAIKMLGVKVPSALKKINVYAGTEHNDVMTGTNGLDVMASFGGNNEFTTGNKGQTVIASLPNIFEEKPNLPNNPTPEQINAYYTVSNSDDSYTVNSFTAGTVIVDSGSGTDFVETVDSDADNAGDKLVIKGVDTNDIHLGMTDLDNLNIGLLNNYDLKDYAQRIAYFTDSKGISNFENINYNGIYKDVISAYAKTLKKGSYGPIANYALNKISSLIKQFRGVAIAVGDNAKTFKNVSETETPEYVADTCYKTLLDKNIVVYDSQGNKQVISNSSMNKYSDIMSERMRDFLITNNFVKYEGESEEPTADIAEFAVYLVTGEDTEGMTKKEKKEAAARYKALKKEFFDIFQNMFIGTSGDNTYTINKDLMGGVFVSGTGSDSFTFKGALGDKNSQNDFTILSSFADNQKDSVTFTNYSFNNHSLGLGTEKSPFTVSGANVTFNGLTINPDDYKNSQFSVVDYQYNEGGELMTGDSWSHPEFLTVTDSNKDTYTASVYYNKYESAPVLGARNNIVLACSKEVNIVSNDKQNIIGVTTIAKSDDKGIFTYEYKGGADMVTSYSDYSNDTYKVAFTKDTKLSITDMGSNGSDSDTLQFTATTSVQDMRLLFNINRDGIAGDMNIVHLDNVNKNNFIIENKGDSRNIVADKGVSFNYNTGSKDGIENIKFGDANLDAGTINKIVTNVQAWLNGAGHDKYADVSDVLAKGSKAEVNQVLAIFSEKQFDLYQVG